MLWCDMVCKPAALHTKLLASGLPSKQYLAMFACLSQVFYAMCQGLLYALCYHLDTLLHQQPDTDAAFEATQLQHVHISSQIPAQLHQDGAQQHSAMSPSQLKQQLAGLLPSILRHR